MRVFLKLSLLSLLLSSCSKQPSNVAESNASIPSRSYPFYTDVQVGPCPANSLMSNAKFDVKDGKVNPRENPSSDAPKLINKKASEILNKTNYVDMASMTGVEELCRFGDWSYIKTIEPDYLKDTHKGWVLSKYLQAEVISDGLKQFPESAYYFGKKERPHKEIIMKGVQMVQRDNDQCKGTIDPATAAMSGSKGSPSDPVFFVTCGFESEAFNVWFSKSDVLNNKAVKALAHLPKSEAVSQCERWVKTKANHPSTVNFSRFLDLALYEAPNGNTRVTTTFKAKNSFGLELEHEVNCLVNAEGLMDGSIKELGS